jgi:hypothetical protein
VPSSGRGARMARTRALVSPLASVWLDGLVTGVDMMCYPCQPASMAPTITPVIET